MPETPDFEQIALRILMTIDHVVRDHGSAPDSARKAVIEDLRLVWNARGAADIATIEAEVSGMMGSSIAAPSMKNLDRAIRKLDR